MAYSDILGEKLDEHNANAFLVNTGWIGGAYGVGKRISLKNTRTIINAILSGELNDIDTHTTMTFRLSIPKHVEGLDDQSILNPFNCWEDPDAFHEIAKDLAQQFVNNFTQFENTEKGKALAAVGPVHMMNS